MAIVKDLPEYITKAISEYTFKAGHFIVEDSPKLSAAIQEVLFVIGYKWADGKRSVSYTDEDVLFIDIDGDITFGAMQYLTDGISKREPSYLHEFTIPDHVRKRYES